MEMKKIVITGADGFIGTHARMYLHELERRGIARGVALNRLAFEDDATLASAVAGADGVIHLAGVNRGSGEEVESGNVSIAKRLIDACEKASVTPHIVFASSLHEDRDTPYGRGKKEAAQLFEAFGKTHQSQVTIFVLPHVFGEFAKPNYNSAVATFVHDLAAGRPSDVNAQGVVELVYVRTVVERMVQAILDGAIGRVVVPGERQPIQEVYALLADFSDAYRAGNHPAISNRHTLALFNTLQSAMFETQFPLVLEPHADERGVLYELVRSGRNDQVFFSTTKPRKVRGNHYHTHKMERFCVIQGEGEIAVRKLLTDATKVFRVSGNNPVAIDMPTYHSHYLKNVGDGDLVTLFWISEQFNPDDPDTFSEMV